MAITIQPARYARGRFVVNVPSDGSGYKTRAHHVVCRLGGRWVHRDGGYQVSKTRAEYIARVLRRMRFEVAS